MAEFRLSPAAQHDLERIWRDTRKQWGVEQAHYYTDRLTVAFEVLAEIPLSAVACDDIRVGYRCRHVERHVIYFRVTVYGIAITRILHDCMDAKRHL